MSWEQMNSSLILTRDSIVTSARKHLGIPFRHQGRNARGMDCAGLIICTGKDIGYVDPEFDINSYPKRSPHGQAFLRHFKQCLVKKTHADLKPGAIVVVKEPVVPCHCGILGERNGELTLIHAYLPYKKVTEDYFYQQDWNKRLVGVFEFGGTEPWVS